MLLKLLICSSILCLALADVKHLSRTYLPPSLPEVIERPNKLTYLPPVPQEAVQVLSEVIYRPPASQEVVNNSNVFERLKSHDVPYLTNNQVEENDSQSVAVTKEASKDPVYGSFPFGGIPGVFPGVGFGGQMYPRPVFPPQAFPGQGFPGPSFQSPGGFINTNFPLQAFPGQGFPVQGFPVQGFPGQGFPGQGFPGQGFPGSGFINPGFPGQPIPNYPVYFSTSEKLQTEAKEDNEDDKLRVRVVSSDTQYDNKNGGYMYNKPSVTF